MAPAFAAIASCFAETAGDLVAEADRELVERMAEVVAGRIRQTGCCSTGALVAKGFTERDVYRLWLPVCGSADEKLLSRQP